MKRFFQIPAGSVILPEVNATAVNISHDTVESWYRETRQINGSPTDVVVLWGPNVEVAIDGPWVDQLDSCIGGCDGGVGPVPGDQQRLAYGGCYQPVPTGYNEVRFTTTGDWVTLTEDVVILTGYEPDSSDGVDFDPVGNGLILNWPAPVPTGKQTAQVTVVWSVAAVGNDQIYEFGVVVNGSQITPPSGRAVLSYERAGDVETLVQQGIGPINNGDRIQLIVRNVNGTNPLRLYGVNAKVIVTVSL